jgi:Fe-S cluster assembly scaffold protein SufB
MLNALDKKLLSTVADLHDVPQGAYSIRKDGESLLINSIENIVISPKKDRPGIDIKVKPGTKNQAVHIPVIISMSGIKEVVYNTIEIGEDADILLVAGCGIHNPGSKESRHDGVHEIIIGKNAKLRYVEKHYGEGTGKGKRVLNPKTVIEVHENGTGEFEMVQIEGVDDTHRITEAKLHERARLIMTEKLMTHQDQKARSDVVVELLGKGSSVKVVSRSVAKGSSLQVFQPRVVAKAEGKGHVECDSIIMDSGKIRSVPEIWAEHPLAELTHEAAIGKIAGEQIIKLMSLGLTEEEAVRAVIEGFLR